jgi:RNA polymerase sigma-54 factor
MYTIMQFQYDYFLTGDKSRLKPMILKDISDITGFDISTISRVASSKYVLTEFGIKSLKEFFSESITKEDGEEASTIEVKEILKDMINDEDKQDPYSDEDLRLLLIDKGYSLSRRTIAKYREHMNIPVGRLRREI